MTSLDSLEDPRTSGASRDLGRGRGLPFSSVLGVVSGLAILTVAASEIRDIDLFWHLLAGAEIASGTPINSLGKEWSYAPEPRDWTSTQWLAELLLYGVYNWGSWTALAGLRVASAAVAIALLAQTTLRHRPKALAGLPYLVAITAIAYASQERPQQATFIGAAALGGVLTAGLTRSALPRWFVLVPATILWANLHGGWILVPVVMGLIALGRALDHGPTDPTARRSAAYVVLTLTCGLVTPAGLAGVTAAFRLKEATALIQEWQPTQPVHAFGVLTVLMLAFMGVGWARSHAVPASEVAAFFASLLFSWTAWRNVAPGLALAAPLVGFRLTAAFPQVRRSEPGWSVPLGIGSAVLLTLLSLVSLVGREHLPRSSQPIDLARQVGELPAGQRVLNDYNAAGMVLYFGGNGTRVGIDGRADRYGADYIEDYIGIRNLKGEWEELVDRLDPTSALFEEDMAIAHVLETERGWKVLGRENGWVLLAPAP